MLLIFKFNIKIFIMKVVNGHSDKSVTQHYYSYKYIFLKTDIMFSFLIVLKL